ncbi:septal ring lytic transglycosylase RlpA family protein [Hydrogenophaga sp.]|uniref:septal ring lytic transglycosylase RlpA family protein n=1 Tax=Hydrogenophaga sp. TaxID=1904254 RepID=UPI002AC9698D|nr:septal ring lytic transglycosylase RlpA family protein [Hydrogenophaga sp.]
MPRHTRPPPVATTWHAVWPFLAVAAIWLVGCSGNPLQPLGSEEPAPVKTSAQKVVSDPRPALAPAVVAVTSVPAVERTDTEPPAEEAAPTPAASDAGMVLAQGRASWYGKRFHGRRTASGERFDMHALTAAHRTLPFGSRVRVRSVHTGKEVVVRINDRGPHKHQRIIDLSYAAAKALGVHQRGVTEVLVLRE